MKKTYSKPDIMFEDFSLSTNIAAGCEVQDVTPTSTEVGCGLVLPGIDPIVVFVNNCTSKGDDDINSYIDVGDNDGEYGSENSKVCYHVPSGTSNIFNS